LHEPKNCWTSLMLRGGFMFIIQLTLSISINIWSPDTMCPNNLIFVASQVHFSGLIFSFALFKILAKLWMCLKCNSTVFEWITMSSRYTWQKDRCPNSSFMIFENKNGPFFTPNGSLLNLQCPSWVEKITYLLTHLIIIMKLLGIMKLLIYWLT